MKLGIFDSGIGGEAIANALRITFPDAEIITISDKEHLPYGDKSQDEVTRLTDTAIQPFLSGNCDVIVLACNTATALTIDTLRERYPSQKFIGIEPMIKTAAALTKTRIIGVCATPSTLSSSRYHSLIEKYGADLKIIEPDCSDWANLIENDQINREHVKKVVDEICDAGADIIVLGCTHYHWIKDLVIDIVDGRAEVIEPSEAIGRRVKQLLNLG